MEVSVYLPHQVSVFSVVFVEDILPSALVYPTYFLLRRRRVQN